MADSYSKMQPHSNAEHLAERVKELREEAATHKKAQRYHRRRLRECLTEAEKFEKQLAEYGIKVVKK